MKKSEIINMKTVGYYSGFGGIEIKFVEYGVYGIDDYIIYVAGAWCSARSVHRCKVYFTMSGSPYFKYKGVRIHLEDCVRC